MGRSKRFALGAAAVFGLMSSSPAMAVNIVPDFSFGTFFNGDATARAAVEKAAQDVSNAITTSLAQVAPSNTAVVNGSSATFGQYFNHRNPYDDNDETYTPPTVFLPANEIRIFVGARNLTGSTLGIGGPDGSYGGSTSAFNSTDRNAAIVQAAAAATNNLKRGGGPTIMTLGGTFDPGGDPQPFSISMGSNLGTLYFDSDTNNDGATDSATTLGNNWHFNANTPVAAGKSDLYSVALHEILHVLGIGSADSWDARITGGDDWNGPAVQALLGTGTNVLELDGRHIRSGRIGRRMGDLVAQEAVMDPSLTVGTRKILTDIDLAFLQDIGWSTVPVPEPSSALVLAGLPVLLLGRRQRQRQTAA